MSDSSKSEYIGFKAGKYEVTIEPLLYGDFYIAVYKDEQLVLDKKYYVNNLTTAVSVAKVLIKQYAKREKLGDF